MNAPLKNIQLSTVKTSATTAGKQLLQKPHWAGCDSCYFLFSLLLFLTSNKVHIRFKKWLGVKAFLLGFSRCPANFLNRFGTMKMQWCCRLPPEGTYRKEKETTLISARGNQARSQRRTLSVIRITSPHPCNCSSKLEVSAAYTKREENSFTNQSIKTIPTLK